jgi:hypothetical protein
MHLIWLRQVGERMRAAQFERQFEERVGALRAAAATLQAACGETRHNKLLPSLLMTCLAAGNFLNSGNRAGAAAGFALESLLKLKAVRSAQHPGHTLLHHIALEVTHCTTHASWPCSFGRMLMFRVCATSSRMALHCPLTQLT